MEPNYILQSYPSVADLSIAAAEMIIDIAINAVAQRGRFAVSLSGGSTPGQLFSLLSTEAYKDRLPWKNTFVFWGDERCVPSNDERNNAYMAKMVLLDKVAIPFSNIFPVSVDLSPADAAKDYEKSIKDFFGTAATQFDLVLLGMGENAHTASLFPGTPVLHEHISLVKEVYVEEQKMFRVTMTAELINQAHNIVFLVTGKAKAAVLQTVLNEAYQPEKYPAQLIKPGDGKLYWLVDEAAAALIK